MTQYLISVHGREGDPTPSDEDMQKAYTQVDAFNERLKSSGAWVFAGGLHEPSTATVVDGTRGGVVTTDGPFGESKEFLGGFWIVNAGDLDAALELAAEGSTACGAPVEVRPFQDEPA